MHNLPEDSLVRTTVINPKQSFILQAPAGSGKTTLLVERYLNIIAHTHNPEQIIAITFTRKAAHNMLERITNCLANPHLITNPTLKNKFTTPKLSQLSKKILDNPECLKIMTFDGFNHYILQQTNLYSLPISPNPTLTYQAAARNFCKNNLTNSQHHQAMTNLLNMLDADIIRMQNFCAELLAKRDQWLPLILNPTITATQEQLSHNFKIWQEMEINSAINIIHPLIDWPELSLILQFCNTHHPMPLAIPQAITPNNPDSWVIIAQILLTKNGQPKKRFTKNDGLPTTNPRSKIHKKRLTDLVNAIPTPQEFANHLNLICLLNSDPPSQEANSQITSLLELLPLLAAELQLEFNRRQQYDHTEISGRAHAVFHNNTPPGEENSSDIVINLNHQLHHLMIDEFQDTSLSQYNLIIKLISSWQPGSERTIFCVGDPMQSIYGFRQAEVGLFYHTIKHGIGPIILNHQQLTTNFRSNNELVEFCNNNFSEYNNRNPSSIHQPISYTNSQAFTQTSAQPKAIITLDPANKPSELIKQLTESITQQKTIAILLRSRKLAPPLIALLNEHNITFNAVEIAPITELPIVQDATNLAKVIYSPHDKTAWASFLASPIVGLTIEQISNAIWQLKNHQLVPPPATWPNLLPIANEIVKIISKAQNSCYYSDIITTIKSAWLALEANQYYPTTTHNCLDNIWSQLANLTHNQLAPNWEDLNQVLSQTYQSYSNTDTNIDLMTIHKAKGLEFDHVYLVGLNQRTINDAHNLFAWQQLLDNQKSTLLAPLGGRPPSTNYQALRLLQKIRTSNERQRLTYVAYTRAKEKLVICEEK